MEGAELSGSLWGLSADDLCTGAGDVAAGVVSVLESRRCEGWLRVVPVCNLRSGKPQPVSRQDLGPPSLQCYRHHHHHVHHHHIVSLGPSSSPSIWYNIDPRGKPELQKHANLAKILGNILDCNGKGVQWFGGWGMLLLGWSSLLGFVANASLGWSEETVRGATVDLNGAESNWGWDLIAMDLFYTIWFLIFHTHCLRLVFDYNEFSWTLYLNKLSGCKQSLQRGCYLIRVNTCCIWKLSPNTIKLFGSE